MAVTSKNIYQIAGGTAAKWAATTAAMAVASVIMFESDTGKMKVSDGTSLYSALPYVIDEVFTTDMKYMFDNIGQAGGLVVLNGSGKIDADLLPVSVGVKPQIVASWTVLQAIPEADRTGLYIVNDMEGNMSVSGGYATLYWDETNAEFIKLSESESTDIDFTNFVQEGDSIARLADDATYVKFTVTERNQLATLNTNYTALLATVNANYSTLSGRATTAEGTITSQETRLAANEAGLSALEADAIMINETNVFMSVTPDDLGA